LAHSIAEEKEERKRKKEESEGERAVSQPPHRHQMPIFVRFGIPCILSETELEMREENQQVGLYKGVCVSEEGKP